ncbi:uncharacterized protein [Nicotiana tomentosiformis]|uniref:uncharacterized protein n=1 Tax=Nicotiana tomentosiformis TaxID=4098 RepID=UPI00388C6CDC
MVPAMPEDDQHRLERWWETYKRRRPVGAVPLTWQQFSVVILEKFVPQSRRDELHRQFERLHQCDMSVTQYEIWYSELDLHAISQIEMVRSQEWVEREAKRPRGLGDFSDVPSGGQFYRGRGCSYRRAQTGRPAHRGASASHGNSLGYQEQQFRQRRGCFECGELGHFKRDCPRLLSGSLQQHSLTTAPAQTVTPPAQPARGRSQAAWGRSRGGGRSGGCQARFYAFPSRPDTIASDAMITVSPVYVSIPVGDIITIDCVYRLCVITVGELETRVDLLLPGMVDFDVILGMDWLSPCHGILDCHAKIVMLTMPGLSKVEWRGSIDFVPSRILLLLIQYWSSETFRIYFLQTCQSSLYDRIRECQYDDPYLLVLKDTVRHDDAKEVTIGDDGVLRMYGRLCVPNVDDNQGDMTKVTGDFLGNLMNTINESC